MCVFVCVCGYKNNGNTLNTSKQVNTQQLANKGKLQSWNILRLKGFRMTYTWRD